MQKKHENNMPSEISSSRNVNIEMISRHFALDVY